MEIIEILDEETYDVNNDMFSDSSSDNESIKETEIAYLRKILVYQSLFIRPYLQYLLMVYGIIICDAFNDQVNEEFEEFNWLLRYSEGKLHILLVKRHVIRYIKNSRRLYIKHRPRSSTSEALLNYITLELKDISYHSLIKSYPALGQILEAVEANRLKDWIRNVQLLDKQNYE
ncbi:hypothetical protein C1646_752547 [Rhizophagus diaphanus]|nr:hypothetical protein C1646_752547 [Rhizophagus diaphanus] [Rhizophagus sp. MUCL 43196]